MNAFSINSKLAPLSVVVTHPKKYLTHPSSTFSRGFGVGSAWTRDKLSSDENQDIFRRPPASSSVFIQPNPPFIRQPNFAPSPVPTPFCEGPTRFRVTFFDLKLGTYPTSIHTLDNKTRYFGYFFSLETIHLAFKWFNIKPKSGLKATTGYLIINPLNFFGHATNFAGRKTDHPRKIDARRTIIHRLIDWLIEWEETIMDLDKLKVAELRTELSSRGLDTKGTKPVLLARLREAILKQNNAQDHGKKRASPTRIKGPF